MFKQRKHISFLLIGAFLVGMLWQTVTIVHFYLNRQEIAETYCVNKDKPETNCKGQCHLNKQLEKTEPTGQAEQEQQQPEAKSPLVFLLVFAETDYADNFNEDKLNQWRTSHEEGETSDFLSEHFQPPRYC